MEAAKNTDRELWREREGDYYADSIHITQDGGIGMNCGGYVVVKPIREWHAALGWRCKAGSLPSGDVQDCDWPNCGCDPHAERMIEGLSEQGWIGGEEASRLERALRTIASLPMPEQDNMLSANMRAIAKRALDSLG